MNSKIGSSKGWRMRFALVLVTAVAWIVYGQKLDMIALAAIGLIVTGVVILNLRAGHG